MVEEETWACQDAYQSTEEPSSNWAPDSREQRKCLCSSYTFPSHQHVKAD